MMLGGGGVEEVSLKIAVDVSELAMYVALVKLGRITYCLMLQHSKRKKSY